MVVSDTGGFRIVCEVERGLMKAIETEGWAVFQHNKQTRSIILPCSIYKQLQASTAFNKHLGVLARAAIS